MKKAQRVKDALLHRQTDIMPFQMEFDPAAAKRMAQYLQDDKFEEKWDARHISNIMYTGRPLPIQGREGFYLDEYGVTWDRTGEDKDLGTMDTLQIPDITKNAYRFAPLDREALRQDYRDFFVALGDRFPVAGLGLAVYERAWTLCSIPNVLAGMERHPKEMEELFERIVENALEVVDTAAEFPFEAFFVGDDWTCGPQLEMGEVHWRKFIKPALKKIYSRAHQHGMLTIQHSCGNIAPILPDLIEVGLNCYQTVQPEEYNLSWLKKEYGKDLAFWGGLSTKKYLPKYDAAQAKEHAIQTLRVMGDGGGYIAAPSHVLTAEIAPEAILAVLDVFKNQGKYL